MNEGRTIMLGTARGYVRNARTDREAGRRRAIGAVLLREAAQLRLAAFLHLPYVHSEIHVCVDCMLVHANGETNGERPADLPEPWAFWNGRPYDIAMGGEHNEHCTPEDREAGCDCERIEFSTYRCEGCGDVNHGTRHAFTVFYRS